MSDSNLYSVIGPDLMRDFIEESGHPQVNPLVSGFLAEVSGYSCRAKQLVVKSYSNTELELLSKPTAWFSESIIWDYSQLLRKRSELSTSITPVLGSDRDSPPPTRPLPKVQCTPVSWLINGLPDGKLLSTPRNREFPPKMPLLPDGEIDCSTTETDKLTKSPKGNWTRDLFDCDLLFAPVQYGKHWMLWVVDYERKRFDFYCPLRQEPRWEVLKLLQRMLELEWELRGPTTPKNTVCPDFDGFSLHYNEGKPPKQSDGYSCGLFVCLYMEAISRGAHQTEGWGLMLDSESPSKEAVQAYRQQVALELFAGEVSLAPFWADLDNVTVTENEKASENKNAEDEDLNAGTGTGTETCESTNKMV